MSVETTVSGMKFNFRQERVRYSVPPNKFSMSRKLPQNFKSKFLVELKQKTCGGKLAYIK